MRKKDDDLARKMIKSLMHYQCQQLSQLHSGILLAKQYCSREGKHLRQTKGVRVTAANNQRVYRPRFVSELNTRLF